MHTNKFNIECRLSADQIVHIVLYEITAPVHHNSNAVQVSLDNITKPIHLKNIVKAHLYEFGISKLRQALPDKVILRRQEVISALRGLI